MMGRSTGWLGVLVMVGACTEAGGERPVSLCERYAEAAERVVGGWYEELELTVEQAEENARGHLPAIGGPNARLHYPGPKWSRRFDAPEVESRCSRRELSLGFEFPVILQNFSGNFICLISSFLLYTLDSAPSAPVDPMSLILPPHQNSWVNSGSGRSPSW